MTTIMDSAKRGNRFIFLLVVAGVIVSISLGFFFTDIELTPIENVLIAQVLLLTVPIILYFLITKSNIKDTLQLHKTDTINVLLAIGIGFFIQPFLGLINILSQLVFENRIQGAIMPMLELPLWMLLLMVAVLPSINEEFVMRGILMTNYKHIPVVRAALINGLCFGLLHMNGNQFTYAFVMGIMLFYLVKITGSIYTSMIVHFIVNGTNMVLVKGALIIQKMMSPFIKEDITQQAEAMDVSILTLIPASMIMTLLTLPFVIFFFYLAKNHNKKKELLTEGNVIGVATAPRDRIFDGYLVGSIVLFVIMVGLNEIIIPMLIASGKFM